MHDRGETREGHYRSRLQVFKRTVSSLGALQISPGSSELGRPQAPVRQIWHRDDGTAVEEVELWVTSIEKVELIDTPPSSGDERLLIPGWAGELSEDELVFIQERLRRSRRSFRLWKIATRD